MVGFRPEFTLTNVISSGFKPEHRRYKTFALSMVKKMIFPIIHESRKYHENHRNRDYT